jgi:hypothetical protein
MLHAHCASISLLIAARACVEAQKKHKGKNMQLHHTQSTLSLQAVLKITYSCQSSTTSYNKYCTRGAAAALTAQQLPHTHSGCVWLQCAC